ncbi:hypothetical protein BgiMline_018617 [Biomphalaria glabrata]|nr:hypothetical protein BgiMline_006230 [Biomphalaria glabrata]
MFLQIFSEQLFTNWLHVGDSFSTCVGKLDNLQNGLAHVLDRVNAGAEGQEKDVQPSDEKCQWPANDDEKNKPAEGPNDPWTQLPFSRTFARAVACPHVSVARLVVLILGHGEWS